MADHKSYMHKSFPSSKNNEHGAHLNSEHDLSHNDEHLRDREEAHSAEAGDMGDFTSGHVNR